MTRPIVEGRRDASVAAVAPGPASSPHVASAGDQVVLPAVLLAALEATGTGVHRFLDRLRHGAIWQDEAIRSADGGIDIQAYLPPEGLRCVIRIGRSIYYHHPLRTFHVYGMPPPAIDVGDGVPLARILPHGLLDAIPIVATRITHLNAVRPDLGICIRVVMPAIEVAQPDVRP